MRLLLSAIVWAGLLAAGPSFTGKWASSQSGSAGTLRIQFQPEAEVTFTLNSQEIPTKVVKANVTPDSFEIDYDFLIDGFRLRSHASGTIKGDQLEGKYQTTSIEDGSAVDAGTLSASAVKPEVKPDAKPEAKPDVKGQVK